MQISGLMILILTEFPSCSKKVFAFVTLGPYTININPTFIYCKVLGQANWRVVATTVETFKFEEWLIVIIDNTFRYRQVDTSP